MATDMKRGRQSKTYYVEVNKESPRSDKWRKRQKYDEKLDTKEGEKMIYKGAKDRDRRIGMAKVGVIKDANGTSNILGTAKEMQHERNIVRNF